MDTKKPYKMPSLPPTPEMQAYNDTPFELIEKNSSVEGQILYLYYLCKEEDTELRKEIDLLYADFRDTRLEVNGGRLYTEQECQVYIDKAAAIRNSVVNKS